ncbi:MAG: recombinase family protein [bacterium]|nr:recombinase family protein [bacterium]
MRRGATLAPRQGLLPLTLLRDLGDYQRQLATLEGSPSLGRDSKGAQTSAGATPGFMEMLRRVAANGARTIIVGSPDRFARDLTVQLTGHDMLKDQDIALVPASAPDFFTEDTPTAVLVRQVLGAIAQFEKATIVAKLAAARKRKREATGKCEGRKPLAELQPDAVALARRLRRRKPKGGQMSLRAISAELAAQGHLNERGQPFNPKSIATMLAR